MKRIVFLISMVAALHQALGQQQVPRNEALKVAFFLSQDLKVLQGTPIPTDVDLKYPVAMREGDYGAMVLPEVKLTSDAIKSAGEAVVPVGQLWLHHLTPIQNGDPVAGNKLKIHEIQAGDTTAQAAQCALGVRKNASGVLQLVIFGKDKYPIAEVPLKTTSYSKESPIQMDAEHAPDDSGRITLKLVGQYQATIPVTQLEP